MTLCNLVLSFVWVYGGYFPLCFLISWEKSCLVAFCELLESMLKIYCSKKIFCLSSARFFFPTQIGKFRSKIRVSWLWTMKSEGFHVCLWVYMSVQEPVLASAEWIFSYFTMFLWLQYLMSPGFMWGGFSSGFLACMVSSAHPTL